MNNFNLSNGLNSILNAQKAGIDNVIVKKNNILVQILNLLLKNKFIKGYKLFSSYFLSIELLYFIKIPAISNIFFVSKPSRRVYRNVFSLKTIIKKKELGTYVISTNRGLMNIKDSVTNNLGGEVLFYII